MFPAGLKPVTPANAAADLRLRPSGHRDRPVEYSVY